MALLSEDGLFIMFEDLFLVLLLEYFNDIFFPAVIATEKSCLGPHNYHAASVMSITIGIPLLTLETMVVLNMTDIASYSVLGSSMNDDWLSPNFTCVAGLKV